jgi:hypothetical protein
MAFHKTDFGRIEETKMEMSPEDVDEMIEQIGTQILTGSCTWEKPGTFRGKDIYVKIDPLYGDVHQEVFTNAGKAMKRGDVHAGEQQLNSKFYLWEATWVEFTIQFRMRMDSSDDTSAYRA